MGKSFSMSRAEAVRIIEGKGSVLLYGYNGDQPIASVALLPSEADFAKGDPAAEAMAMAKLQADMANLKHQIAMLQGPTPAAVGPASIREDHDPQAGAEQDALRAGATGLANNAGMIPRPADQDAVTASQDDLTEDNLDEVDDKPAGPLKGRANRGR